MQNTTPSLAATCALSSTDRQKIFRAFGLWIVGYEPAPAGVPPFSAAHIGEVLDDLSQRRFAGEKPADFYMDCARKHGFSPPVVDAFIAMAKDAGLVPDIVDAGQLLAAPPAPPRVTINPANHTATLHFGVPYELCLADIKNEYALLVWLLHLCEKSWMDTAGLHEVATTIGKHLGFHLELH